MHVEMNLNVIRRRYLAGLLTRFGCRTLTPFRHRCSGWFAVDSLSSMPITIAGQFQPGVAKGKIMTTFRFLKLFRLLKLVRSPAIQEVSFPGA
jgi:hypothetical protein